MFERYNEKARRVIFFARHEASQYGSRQIGTEHILLGVLREGHTQVRQLLGHDVDASQIRTEIEKVITKGETFSTSVEVPLSEESKKVLQFAAQEAERLGDYYVAIEHFLLGILRVDGSIAARILKERGGQLAPLREKVAKLSSSIEADVKLRTMEEAVAELHRFLARLRMSDPGELKLRFAKDAQFVDSKGERWRGREKIGKESRRLFNAYAKENVTSLVESVDAGPGHTFVASVRWENVIVEGEQTKSIHRMTVILGQEGEAWVVFFLHVTPVAAL
jgi:Clp amino terminal domain, pathogenicity island component